MALERDVRLVRCEDGQLEIALEPTAPKTLVHDLQRKLTGWTGKRWIVVVSQGTGRADYAGSGGSPAGGNRAWCAERSAWCRLFSTAFRVAKVVGVTQNAPETGGALRLTMPDNEDQ